LILSPSAFSCRDRASFLTPPDGLPDDELRPFEFVFLKPLKADIVPLRLSILAAPQSPPLAALSPLCLAPPKCIARPLVARSGIGIVAFSCPFMSAFFQLSFSLSRFSLAASLFRIFPVASPTKAVMSSYGLFPFRRRDFFRCDPFPHPPVLTILNSH